MLGTVVGPVDSLVRAVHVQTDHLINSVVHRKIAARVQEHASNSKAVGEQNQRLRAFSDAARLVHQTASALLVCCAIDATTLPVVSVTRADKVALQIATML